MKNLRSALDRVGNGNDDISSKQDFEKSKTKEGSHLECLLENTKVSSCD
jgi:hypothetical protein